MIKYISLFMVGLFLSGCAGKATFKNYDVIDGKKVLTSITEIKARNIRAKTVEGAEADSKPVTFPEMPSFFPIGN